MNRHLLDILICFWYCIGYWIFWNFSKIILRKLIMHHFSIFFKNLTNHALIFRVFGRKTQIAGKFWKFWWQLHRKFEFLFSFYFGKFVTKNRAFGNNTIFLHFFRFGGWDFHPGFPLGTGVATISWKFCSFLMNLLPCLLPKVNHGKN